MQWPSPIYLRIARILWALGYVNTLPSKFSKSIHTFILSRAPEDSISDLEKRGHRQRSFPQKKKTLWTIKAYTNADWVESITDRRYNWVESITDRRYNRLVLKHIIEPWKSTWILRDTSQPEDGQFTTWGWIYLYGIYTMQQVANISTKGFIWPKFELLVSMLAKIDIYAPTWGGFEVG